MSKRQDMGVARRLAYDMPGGNAGLPCREGLGGLCLPDEGKQARTKAGLPVRRVPRWAFTAEPGLNTWLDPGLLERALDLDPRLRQVVEDVLEGEDQIKPGTKREARALRSLEKHVQRVFEEAVLVDIVERFEAVLPLVLSYVLAKGAVRVASPGRFPEPEPDDEEAEEEAEEEEDDDGGDL